MKLLQILQTVCGLFGHKWVYYTKGQMCRRCGKKKNMDKWYYDVKGEKEIKIWEDIDNPDLASKKRDANFVWTDEKSNYLD